MTDRTYIRDLAVRAVLGINDWEREKRQDVTINITLHTDHRRAAATDSIDDAVDYRALKRDVVALAETSSFRLVEALAEAVAARCLADPRVATVDVAVDKPGALRFARSVGVEITRDRGGRS